VTLRMSTVSPTPSARLNVFQQLMRRWDAVHPYNAAQAIHIRGTPDRPTMDRAWQSALVATGLGAVAVDADRYRFEALNGHAAAFSVRFPSAGLADHVSAELNRPFDDPHEPPFRPFVVGDADGFHAGVVYQHWLADSVAIRLLMREWFVRAYDPAEASDRPLRLPTCGYGDGLCGGRDAFDIVGGMLALTRRHCRLRRVQKVASTNLSDPATRVALFPAEPGLIGRVRLAAARRRVKVNDVFLAALAEACATHVPMQRRPTRNELAVGSIVDLRPRARADLSRTFGLYLGFTNVACRPVELARFDELVAAVARQTRHQKTTGVASTSLSWMSAALLLGRFSKPGELYHFYRKDMPLAAGISNLDLSRSWVARYAPSVITDYVRVSPTGPMGPLAMTTTTMGDRFQLGLTHRTGLIDADRAAAVAASVLGRLRSL
jgi:hypothetical protein